MSCRWAFVALVSLAAAALSCAGPANADRLIADLEAEHWQVRASAAEALGDGGGARAIAPLRKALDDESPEVRGSAVRSLGRLGAREALDDVRKRIRDDKDREVLVQSIFTLAALAPADSRQRQGDINLLVDRVTDERRYVNSAARRALYTLVPRGELAEMVRQDLRARSPQVRHRASLIANALELPELAGWHEPLLSDSDPDVRAAAFEAILRGPRSEDYGVLVRGLEDESPTVRLVAAIALGELGDRSALPALVKVAGGDDDADARDAAASAMAALDRIRGVAMPALWHIERLDDRVVVAADGARTITRTIAVAVDSSPEPIRELKLLLPRSMPRVDRVADAAGNPLSFRVVWEEGRRHVVFPVPPIGNGEARAFTFVASSRRPLSLSGGSEIFVDHAPGPVGARVAALHVEVALPASGIRGVAPEGLRVTQTLDGATATLERAALTPQDLEELVVRVSAPASSLKLEKAPARSHSRFRELTAIVGVVATILGCLVATVVRLRRRLGEQAGRMILAAVLVAGAILFLTPILLEDNLPYYALARSAVLDGDLDRANEYVEFNQTQAFSPDNRGAQDPLFASLMRAPFVAAAHALTSLGNGFFPANAPNGFSFPYLFLAAVGDFFAVLIGCLACFSLVERRVGGRHALYSVLAAVFGTNLLLFAYAWTGSSFQPSFMLFSVFLNHWDETRDDRSRADWLAGGVLLGLLGMTRTLNFGFVVIPFLDWLRSAAGRNDKGGRAGFAARAGDGALLVSGMLLAFAPQLIVQRIVDQRWFVDAYGLSTGRFSGLRDNAWDLFFSGTHGLFTSMPVLALAFIGLVPLLKLDRRLGTVLTAALAVQLFAIGSYELYWGFFVYGTPYLVPCTAIFCLSLASLLREVEVRWRTAGPAVLYALTAVLSLRNGWCLLRQMAERTIGDLDDRLGIVPIVHKLLLLDRKLDEDILRYSSEFGCLVRELLGAVRALDAVQLVTALFWVFVIVAPVILAFPVAARIRPRIAAMPRRTRVIAAAAAFGVVWLGVTGWLVAIARNTDLDYAYRHKEKFAQKRELGLERLGPGQSFTWNFESANPSDRFTVITFLDDAADAREGERVATIEVHSGETNSQSELRAGIDTADFAVDRPESAGERAHGAPLDRAAFSFRVRDDSGQFYTARAYRSVLMSPHAARTASLKVTSSLKRGTVVVVVAAAQERKISRDSSRRRWLADRR